MIPVVEELASLLHDQPENPMRPCQARPMKAEIDRLEAMARDPFAGSVRGAVQRRARQVRQMYERDMPKKIEEPHRRNRVNALAKDVLKNVIVDRLISKSETDRNPPGAVGYQMRHGEYSKPFKRAAMTWKRAMFALDPHGGGTEGQEDYDRDFANYVRYQPAGLRADGTAHYMAGAQVPGHFAMSPLARQNWPFDHEPESPLKTAREREHEHEITVTTATKAEKTKRPMSDKQRAHIERLKALALARAKKEGAADAPA